MLIHGFNGSEFLRLINLSLTTKLGFGNRKAHRSVSQKGTYQKCKDAAMNTNHSYHTVFIDHSVLNSVKEGKFYTTIRLGDQLFLFDENGKRTLISEPEVRWKNADEVVMIAKIKASHLDSVIEGNIYRVFNDEANDERYIIDESGERVLFDKMIFKYDLI